MMSHPGHYAGGHLWGYTLPVSVQELLSCLSSAYVHGLEKKRRLLPPEGSPPAGAAVREESRLCGCFCPFSVPELLCQPCACVILVFFPFFKKKHSAPKLPFSLTTSCLKGVPAVQHVSLGALTGEFLDLPRCLL